MPDALQPAHLDRELETPAARLTPKQLEVVTRAMRPNREIARELGIAEVTVKLHLGNATALLGLDRYEIMAALGADFPQAYPEIIVGSPAEHTSRMQAFFASLGTTKQRVLPYSWLEDREIAAVTGINQATAKTVLLEVTRGLETSRNNLILKLAAAGLLQPRPDTNALPHFSPATREQLAHFLAGENADTVSPQQQLSPRRQQMLRRITWQYQDIARDLDMQTATVKSHMRDLAHQIGLSRQEIIVALGGMTDALIIDSPGSELDTLDARLALLSSAQRRVLPYLWLADKDIARVCNMSYHAAVVHIENILYVAGPASRLELIRHLARTGQLAPQPPAEQLPAFAPGIRRYLAQLLAQPE